MIFNDMALYSSRYSYGYGYKRYTYQYSYSQKIEGYFGAW